MIVLVCLLVLIGVAASACFVSIAWNTAKLWRTEERYFGIAWPDRLMYAGIITIIVGFAAVVLLLVLYVALQVYTL